MIKKYYLLSPGPTPVPEQALSAAAEPIIHHRTSEFSAIFMEVIEGLKYVFETKEDVFILTSSGSGAMETAVINTLNAGDKVITISGGKFGERWERSAAPTGSKSRKSRWSGGICSPRSSSLTS